MNKLELGTYVNCKDLPIEKVEKLLRKFVELAEETPNQIDDTSVYSEECDCYLVYCKEGYGNVIIWFWDDKFTCDKEMFYEDFFPEEQEDVVKRVRTIDLERDTRTFEVKIAEFEWDFLDLMEGSSLTEILELFNTELSKNMNEDASLEVFEKAGDPKFYIYQGGSCEVVQSYKVESEEAYQNRVKREKELNDMYNKDIQQLQKKLTIAKKNLKDLENTIKVMSPDTWEYIVTEGY